MIRFGKWNDILAEPEPEEWRLVSRAERHFARSIAFSSLGKFDEAQKELAELNDVAQQLTEEWKVGNNQATKVMAVAGKMAEGELAFRKGEREKAFELLRQAVEAEEALQYDEPPGWMQPVRHALGALLLADNRPLEAEEVYREDLRRHPKNAWSLLGLQQALRQQTDKQAEADALEPQVKQAWARADVKPVASCYCHPDALRSK
jgi:tetratricopeptide (TPR) repeat protein